jgi:hypothetical protein
MKNITVLSLAASLIVSANVAHAITALTYPYEYDFVQTGGVGTFTSALFLDASSSSSGSALDIGPGSFLDTPDGNFSLGNGSGQPSWNVTDFSWTTTGITTIDLNGFDFSEQFTITAGSIEEHITADPTGIGSYVAANQLSGVPDGASTALMLGLVSGALGMARRRFGRNA